MWGWKGWQRLGDGISSGLAGYGLDPLWASKGWAYFQRYGWKVVMAVYLSLLIVFSSYGAYIVGSTAGMSADREWQDALTYIREETPPDAVVMTQWSWGYWILNLGQRRPVVDNGYYGHPPSRDYDVAMVYFTSEPSEVVKIMKKYRADYLIFSELDLEYDKSILSWADLDEQYDSFPAESMFSRSLGGEFDSAGGLEVVYRSNPDAKVVILGLTAD
jgi:hypothetical protein